jgi:hypothetical protein
VNSTLTPPPARSYGGPATAGVEFDAGPDALIITPEANYTLTPAQVPGFRRQYSPTLLLTAQSSAGVGNGADTTDDTLQSVTVKANNLKAAGKSVEFEAFGSLAANGNNKTIKVFFGATVIATTGVITTSGGSWYAWGTITRTAVGVQTIFAGIQVGLAVIVATLTTGALDETTDLVLKSTGASPTSGAANDVKGNLLAAVVYN